MTRTGRRAGRRSTAGIGRPHALIAGLIALCLPLAGCVGPALTEDTYREKAVVSLEQVRSSLAGVRVALEVAVEGRSFAPATAVNVRQHEETVSWAHSAFATRQPPPGTSEIRSTAEPVLAEAAAFMAEVRIAANRADRARLREQLSEIDDLIRKVEVTVSDVRP